MIKVAIVSDGPYGERAYETIRLEFETTTIKIKPPSYTFIEELELTTKEVKQIKDANILITYTKHPDITLELVDKFSKCVNWIIIAAWNGCGFKNQLEEYKNVFCPNVMCELDKKGDPILDEFTQKIGRPEVEIHRNKDKICDINVIRTSPCGSTYYVAEFLKEKYKDQPADLEDLPREAGLKVQGYPCRAPKLRLFSPEESHKNHASQIHMDSFKRALLRGKNRKE